MPRTNYSRIISKTPEELAEWISFITGHEGYRDVLPEAWLEWLKKEANNG